ncbi:MAG: M3 family oligoendopeptidase [Spirochaetaceae bacterium]
MTFSELPYKRPDMDQLKNKMVGLISEFTNSITLNIQIEIIEKINNERVLFESMASLAHMRHTQDTRVVLYDTENSFFDKNLPLYEDLVTTYFKELISSKFIDELKVHFGEQMFTLAEMKIKSFSPKIIEDMQKENELSSRYNKLLSSAKIPFKGETFNLSGIATFHEDKDRNVRKESVKAQYQYFTENQNELDDIYDKLVKVRTSMAKKMGYENYIPFGYYKMFRSDYDASMVATYRKAVQEHIVPIAEELYTRQWKRLKLEDPKFWDKTFIFPSGNPTPKGDKNWMIQQAKDMYDQLSPETSEFFNFMVDKELLDLETREGKSGGGYCELLPQFGMPFIFSNFNGTSADVDVLTHEAGHAFQVYSSMNHKFIEYLWPTYECCEIHSMSMEFFAWPWMKNFFKEDEDKYKYGHLSSALTFIPYGVMVDEFQHMVYEKPEATPAQRHGFWKDCQKKYYPNIDFGGIPYLEQGGLWQRQAHIYELPFYYIDYTLAQICALQYWDKDNKDHEAAWNSYLTLCKQGGTKSFLKLVEDAGLQNPFNTNTISEVAKVASDWLRNINDDKF